MKNQKKYYKKLDYIRLMSCMAVLLYHLNILKGGYLAVCIFFVLSGYLSCISLFKKEKISFIEYYKKRFIHLYLPLLIVTFISIFVIKLIHTINWISLKPESTSVLFGYNNFWQLSANLDYFARHIDSPFMHFWYISILLQFDLIFPFIFILLRKIGDKSNKIVPCIITFLLTISGIIFFIKLGISNNIMEAYYNTFARVFSLFMGVLLGFIHSYYKVLIPKFIKKRLIKNIVFGIYLLISIVLFIFISSTSKYFIISMIAISIITCRLIDYAVVRKTTSMSTIEKIGKYFAGCSYEIYLIQYPVIFLFQSFSVSKWLNILLVIIITIVLSVILNFATCFKAKNKKLLRFSLFFIIMSLTIIGGYNYFISKDHTKEMKRLEDTLNQNEKIMQLKQEEYISKLKEEEENWQLQLKDLENGTEKIKEIVSKLSIVGVGDSVMLGALNGLYKTFPNGYFDAKVSRTAYVVNDILKDLKNRNILGDPVIFNLGTNGDCSNNCKDKIINTIGNRKIFWITVVNDKEVHVNSKYRELVKKYKNVYLIEWDKASSNHKEYFASDGIHLTSLGIKAYTKTIYDSIYKVYLDEYNQKKQQVINEHEEQEKNKITFYGNNILLNAYKYLQQDFLDAKFNTNKDYDFNSLKESINKDINEDNLSYKVVFVFDNTSRLTKTHYKELIELCKDRQIYILSINKELLSFTNENVTVLNFYNDMKDNMMADRVHLNDIGNQKLSELLSIKLLGKSLKYDSSKS